MNDILSQLLTAFVVALVPVVIGALGYVARAVIGYLKAKTSAEHFAILENLSYQAVAAIEQTMKSKAGQEKLEAAKAVVRGALLKRGIQLDEAQIEAAIESAVYANKGIKVDVDGAAAGVGSFLPDVDGAAIDSTGAAE
jgi:LL-H family phage holin